MGVKNTRTVYVSDRGQEFYVENMEASHLMNVILHHRKQVELLETIGYESKNIAKRAADLRATILVLENELCRHDPDDEAEDSPRQNEWEL